MILFSKASAPSARSFADRNCGLCGGRGLTGGKSGSKFIGCKCVLKTVLRKKKVLPPGRKRAAGKQKPFQPDHPRHD